MIRMEGERSGALPSVLLAKILDKVPREARQVLGTRELPRKE